MRAIRYVGRRVLAPALATTLVVVPAHADGRAAAARDEVTLGSLAIVVPPGEDRAVSFTNGRSAFYYTQARRNDHPEHAAYAGFNVAGRHVVGEHRLVVDGAELDPATAAVVVRPDALVRTYPDGTVETLRLFDDRDVYAIEVSGPARPTELRFLGDGPRSERGDHVVVDRHGRTFYVAVGSTPDAAREASAAAAAPARWTAARNARLATALNGPRYVRADDADLTTALRWIGVTTDQLITRQRGDGIYAGLPWFAEYWGRDSFIALAGATLVTGRFEQARAILASFAKFQDLDPASAFYGRMPNIVKPGSLDYHTTDGTPHWVIALREYVRYSGDASLARELYPNVRASIEGALARFTDASGYLVHADNESWMDARRQPDLAAYAARGTRANDVQALWYEQLRAGAEFARTVGDATSAARWDATADRLRTAFARDFVDARSARIADRLDARGVADPRLRPNLLFALDLVPDDVATRATREAWERLVYPWGVATLDAADPFFHPYHVEPSRWHKDEAYHNGTVWPWLNGIAIERMVERGQVEPAWTLFRTTGELALRRGVVGGLPETLDAYPHPGEREPRLTGTYLQAWSNAEWLRVWYREFLGIRPDLVAGRIELAPRLPAALGAVDVTVRVGGGRLDATYSRTPDGRRYVYRLRDAAGTLRLDVMPFEILDVRADDGDVVTLDARPDGLHVLQADGRGARRRELVVPVSAERAARRSALDAAFANVRFAAPRPLAEHPVMHPVPGPAAAR